MATAHPNHAFISSEDVQGTRVYDKDGTCIGEIDHLMIDKASGKIVYAVMSFGGFLNLGHSHYPLAWDMLSFDPALAGYRAGVREREIHDQPEFSDDSEANRERERRAHSRYFEPPFGDGNPRDRL